MLFALQGMTSANYFSLPRDVVRLVLKLSLTGTA
jgi:hypothetical protein